MIFNIDSQLYKLVCIFESADNVVCACVLSAAVESSGIVALHLGACLGFSATSLHERIELESTIVRLRGLWKEARGAVSKYSFSEGETSRPREQLWKQPAICLEKLSECSWIS